MLSEFKKISEYPTLETPVTIRLGFYKKGALQYISHLDLQRTFQRILSRAELPLWYTQGFNPHPIMAFGSALALGWTSEYELLDVARHSETMEPMVVYRALYGEQGLWVRPVSMWNEIVTREEYTGPRFQYLED